MTAQILPGDTFFVEKSDAISTAKLITKNLVSSEQRKR